MKLFVVLLALVLVAGCSGGSGSGSKSSSHSTSKKSTTTATQAHPTSSISVTTSHSTTSTSSSTTASGTLNVTAEPDDPAPCQPYGNVTILVTATLAGEPAAHAQITSTWYFKANPATVSGTTDADGYVELKRSIASSGSPGFKVIVDIEAQLGEKSAQAKTSFTPGGEC